MPYFRASGGIYSTVFDYAVFLDAWLKASAGEAPGFLGDDIALAALTQATDVAYGMLWEVVGDPSSNSAADTLPAPRTLRCSKEVRPRSDT